MASSYDGMLPRRFCHWMDYCVGNGPMKRNYYIENNINKLIAKAEARVVELKVIQEIKFIDDRLKALESVRHCYSLGSALAPPSFLLGRE